LKRSEDGWADEERKKVRRKALVLQPRGSKTGGHKQAKRGRRGEGRGIRRGGAGLSQAGKPTKRKKVMTP
jgi:hypothetical protein